MGVEGKRPPTKKEKSSDGSSNSGNESDYVIPGTNQKSSGVIDYAMFKKLITFESEIIIPHEIEAKFKDDYNHLSMAELQKVINAESLQQQTVEASLKQIFEDDKRQDSRGLFTLSPLMKIRKNGVTSRELMNVFVWKIPALVIKITSLTEVATKDFRPKGVGDLKSVNWDALELKVSDNTYFIALIGLTFDMSNLLFKSFKDQNALLLTFDWWDFKYASAEGFFVNKLEHATGGSMLKPQVVSGKDHFYWIDVQVLPITPTPPHNAHFKYFYGTFSVVEVNQSSRVASQLLDINDRLAQVMKSVRSYKDQESIVTKAPFAFMNGLEIPGKFLIRCSIKGPDDKKLYERRVEIRGLSEHHSNGFWKSIERRAKGIFDLHSSEKDLGEGFIFIGWRKDTDFEDEESKKEDPYSETSKEKENLSNSVTEGHTSETTEKIEKTFVQPSKSKEPWRHIWTREIPHENASHQYTETWNKVLEFNRLSVVVEYEYNTFPTYTVVYACANEEFERPLYMLQQLLEKYLEAFAQPRLPKGAIVVDPIERAAVIYANEMTTFNPANAAKKKHELQQEAIKTGTRPEEDKEKAIEPFKDNSSFLIELSYEPVADAAFQRLISDNRQKLREMKKNYISESQEEVEKLESEIEALVTSREKSVPKVVYELRNLKLELYRRITRRLDLGDSVAQDCTLYAGVFKTGWGLNRVSFTQTREYLANFEDYKKKKKKKKKKKYSA
eukprot:Platyproteum_vivax@DN7288_c0_g1_i3.p1